jgi:hypothetical protein
MRRFHRWFALAMACCVWAAPAPADVLPGIPVAELFRDATFDPAVPSQLEVLGFHPGSRAMRHAELLRYLEALAQASPHAMLQQYSITHEDRPMVVLAVGDEATIANLERFRQEHARRMDPRGRAAQDDARALEGAKAVAWMAYGIHGDELSSVDAAAAVAYWLVAGTDDLARKMRGEMVVLIDPCENPDGRERFLTQTASFAHALPNPDTEDLSHTTVWPWGRGNHYLFDLNRDWFSMVHPESDRSAVIASWNPQLMVDSHEMGAHDTYLFSPPRHPFNPHLPSYTREWDKRFAADQARALDLRGYGYYTREWNEDGGHARAPARGDAANVRAGRGAPGGQLGGQPADRGRPPRRAARGLRDGAPRGAGPRFERTGRRLGALRRAASRPRAPPRSRAAPARDRGAARERLAACGRGAA